jgi:hypothetical protein
MVIVKTYGITYSLSLQPQGLSEGRNDLERIIRFGFGSRHVAAKVTALEEENFVIFSLHFFCYKLFERYRVVRKDRRTYVWLLVYYQRIGPYLFIYLFIYL